MQTGCRVRDLLIAAACLAAGAVAQLRTSGELRGVVADASGTRVPHAAIRAVDTATATAVMATANGEGAFVLLNLQAGVYEIEVSATGFRTTRLPHIAVETARALDLAIQLEVGQVTESVTVSGTAPLLQTTGNVVSTTIRNDFIQNLPLSGRDTLQFAALMAGAQSPQEATRNSTFNGLPNASINISIDGVNNNSQRFKSGGTSFFGYTPARLDAVEEVTVATAGSGADAAAGSAMSLRFTTRRGSNQFHGRLFHQLENDALNANTFFNNTRGQPKPKVRRNDFGGNIGGPILKNRLFFFANIEYAPRPGSANRSANILTAAAQRGDYTYRTVEGELRTVNVLALAQGAGFPGSVDPAVHRMLDVIDSSRANGTGVIPNAAIPIYETLQWVQPTSNNIIYPTARLDYQITSKLAWHGTWNLRAGEAPGTPVYPGLPGKFSGSKLSTYLLSNTFDWTISPSLLNSFNMGIQSSHEDFNQETSVYQWADDGHRRIAPPAIAGITIATPIANQGPWIRNNPVYTLADNLNWVRGKHTFTFGGSFLRTHFYETTWQDTGVLNYNLGISPGDPVTAVLGQSAFPGIRPTDVAAASALYGFLTGRIASVNGTRFVNVDTRQYESFAPINSRYGFQTGGLYFQDAFRATNRLTLNYGFRWEFSGAIHDRNGIATPPDLANLYGPSTGLFQPGVLNGVANPQLTPRPYTYAGDKINPAPNFGVVWNPDIDNNRTVFRASYGINYYDEGINIVSNRSSFNPGPAQTVSVRPGLEFAPGSLLLSSSMPAPAVNPAAFAFPMPQSNFTFTAGDLSTTMPVLRTPYVQSWNFGVQREFLRGLVIEARYAGNKSTHIWHAYGLNETNIFENGFLAEFQNARRNLEINALNGAPGNFSNRNLPGQAALPIFDAAFAARGTQGALPAASGYTNGAFINQLTLGNAGALANNMATNAAYYCRLVGNKLPACNDAGYSTAGPYPINLFRPNPYVSGLTLLDDGSYSSYHGMQIDVRKSFSHGLQLQGNYVWSKSLSDLFNLDSQDATDHYRTLRNRALDKGPSAFDIRHVFQAFWSYDLPFAPRRRALSLLAGGWQVAGIHRLHSGQVYTLTSNRNTHNNQADSGVLLRGVTPEQLQSMLRTFRPGPNLNAAADPRLTGPDGRPNPQLLGIPSVPGEFGQFVYLYNTPLVVNNLAVSKVLVFHERARLRIQMEGINMLNHPVLGVAAAGNAVNIDSPSFGQTTSIRVAARNIQLRAQLDW